MAIILNPLDAANGVTLEEIAAREPGFRVIGTNIYNASNRRLDLNKQDLIISGNQILSVEGIVNSFTDSGNLASNTAAIDNLGSITAAPGSTVTLQAAALTATIDGAITVAGSRAVSLSNVTGNVAPEGTVVTSTGAALAYNNFTLILVLLLVLLATGMVTLVVPSGVTIGAGSTLTFEPVTNRFRAGSIDFTGANVTVTDGGNRSSLFLRPTRVDDGRGFNSSIGVSFDLSNARVTGPSGTAFWTMHGRSGSDDGTKRPELLIILFLMVI